MSGNISNYIVSPIINNRVCVSACGQGNIDSKQQFCVSTYTSGDDDNVGFCIQATTTPPLDTSTSIQKLLLWLDNLTTNCRFTISCPTSLTLTSPYTSINGSLLNKVFINTTSAYTIPDTHQGNFLIHNTTGLSSSITLPLITASDNGYTITIRNVGSPIVNTLNCSGTNLITASSLASASNTYPLLFSITLLAFTNGAISYWLVI